MSDGFQVILEDLCALADSFDRESDSLRSLQSKVDQHAPDTGQGDLTGTLGDVLDTMSQLYKVLTDVVHGHGQKLHEAHDQYQRTDMDGHELYDRMKDAFGQE